MKDFEDIYYDLLPTAIGDLVFAAGRNGLQTVFFTDKGSSAIPANWRHDPVAMATVAKQFQEYFAGTRRKFEVRLSPSGTPFQRRVWQALTEIPYGETITYKELAERAGSARGYRAAGNANGRNPLVILQPCHRVVAANNGIGGFSSGIFRKRFLLELEGIDRSQFR
ncbi:MAG: methylated-DNA--[protein]-cysteine S-methyltransferase [Desulfopila sp.]|jgi:methylated-DNA-[protein]-cysteine S-methyltransferase|nr:methylated-DNA--[protein]-cysteine S-methyltransferase [Desulfopila sp.]